METEKNTEAVAIEPRPAGLKRTPKKFLALVVIVTIILASGFGALFGFMAGAISQRVSPNIFRSTPSLSNLFGVQKTSKEIIRQQVVEEDSAVTDVVQKSSPAVVSIVISKNLSQEQNIFSPFDFPGFFGIPDPGDGSQGDATPDSGTQKQQVGGGSGFFVTSDGLVVTNRHVVDDTTADYTVVNSEGKEFSAKVLAKDPTNDIAILKVEGSGFPVMNLGDSDSLKIGQTAIAIGNSLGEFSNTVSKGIISGLQRSVTAGGGLSGAAEQLRNIIQTDAAINPGNSGGPLLDINADVIGINVAMAQGAQNIGFAIPINQVKKVVEQVKTTGKISTPYIGVRYIPVDAALQKSNDLPYNYGALVLRGQKMTDFAVIPGSPADKAGLIENDIILEVNNVKVDQHNTLAELIAKYNVGDTITLKIWEKGKEKEVQMTLAELKQ
ncbi:MAG: trypsin-like peptidase domain-containing protein [Parcubacteria group bacterium]|jgi:S1-C subfamily serine protease